MPLHTQPQRPQPAPISLVHSQTETERRLRLHHAMESFHTYSRMQDARLKQAVDTAYRNGKAQADAQQWWNGFLPGVLLGTLLGAGTVAAFLLVAQAGMRA